MRRIRFIQVGDIHYPEWQSISSEVDAKDSKFSPIVSDSVRSSAFRAVLRRLRQLALSDDMHGVVFVGDFTSRGKSEVLEGAFRHFSLLCRAGGAASRRLPLMFVPGNHDVNRQEAFDLGKIEKFRSMSRLAVRFGWEPVPLDRPSIVAIGSDLYRAEFALVNTSVGSWELQNLPEFLREKIESNQRLTAVEMGDNSQSDDGPAIPKNIDSSTDEGDLADQYYGQLDTPYVSGPMLAELMEHLLDEKRAFGVVIGHHNLLPQKTPRISPYAEMLNAGFVRAQLLSANKPVLYLHGHIHQDPIEVVSDPRRHGSQLISISAPEITDGFNELIIFVTDQDDLVGVRVIPYRAIREEGTLVEKDHCFISALLSSRNSLDDETFELLMRLRKYKSSRERDLLFWNEVVDLVKGSDLALKLEDALIMLHAAQNVEIHGLSRPHRDWRIHVKGK